MAEGHPREQGIHPRGQDPTGSWSSGSERSVRALGDKSELGAGKGHVPREWGGGQGRHSEPSMLLAKKTVHCKEGVESSEG